MKPVLLEQSCVPTFAHPATLSRAVLWDFVITLQVDHETTLDLVVLDLNGNAAAASEPSMSVRLGPPSPGIGTPQTATFSGLHVLHTQQVRVDAEGVTFPEPMQPFIESNERLEIGGTRASLGTHIAALLHDLVGDSPFASHELSIECRYSYPVATIPVPVPVLLVPRQEAVNSSMTTLAEQCAGAIQEWRTTSQPPEPGAALMFGVTFWPVGAPDRTPLLRLTSLVLPLTDLTH